MEDKGNEPDKPTITVKRLNQPNFTLMAQAFINLYPEVGTVTK